MGKAHTAGVVRDSESVLRSAGVRTEGFGEMGPQLMFLHWAESYGA